MHYAQVSVWGYSLNSYVFQADVEAKTSNSAALFTGSAVDCCSLRDSLRKLIPTGSTILGLLDHFDYLITSTPSGAGGTSAGPRGGSEDSCQSKAVFVGLLD